MHKFVLPTLLCACVLILLWGGAGPRPAWGQGTAEPPSASGDIQALLAEGKRHLAQQDFKGALQAYEAVLAKDPKNLIALYFAGNLSLQLNQGEKGLRYLGRAVLADPKDMSLRLLLARAFERFATVNDALRVYKNIMETAPGTPEAAEASKRYRMLSGERYLSQGHPEKAQQIFSQLLNDYPNDPTVLSAIKAANLAREQTRAAVPNELTKENLPEAERASSSDIATLMTEGKQRLGRNDAAGALQDYEAILTKDPNNVEALFFAGNLELQLKRPETGLKYLARSVALTPNNIRLRLVLAQAYEQFASPEEAIPEYQQIMAVAPGTPEAREADKHYHLLLGRRALNEGDPRQAIQILTNLLNDYPKDPAVLAELQIAAQANERMQSALQGKAVSPSTTPPSAAVARLLAEGKQRLAKRDVKGALPIYEQALAQDANNPEALYFAGMLSLQLNRPSQGIRYLARDVSLLPNNVRLRLMLAQAYEHYGVTNEALKQYQQILARAPGTPEGVEADAHSRLLSGKLALGQGQLESALDIFSRLLHDHPRDGTLLTDIVNTYVSFKRPDYAQRLLEKVTAAHPDNTLAESFLGDIYSRSNNFPKAIQIDEKLLKQLPPKDPQIRNVTLQLLRMKGVLALRNASFTEAKGDFEQYLAQFPNASPVRLNLAAAYDGLGNLAKAEEILHALVQHYPDYLEARLKLGAIYMQMKRPEDGAAEFEAVRIRGHGAPIANEANGLLERVYAGPQGPALRTRIENKLMQDAKRSVAQAPNNYSKWLNLATTYIALNQAKDAIGAYENVVRIKPQDDQSRLALAGLYDNAGQLDQAKTAYTLAHDHIRDAATRKAIEHNLTMIAGKKALTDNKVGVAETEFKKAVQENPRDFIAHFYLALIYSQQGKYEDAAHEYEAVIKIVPSHAQARLRLGIVYEQLLRDEDALAQYQAALALPSQPADLVQTLKQRLAAVKKRINGFDYSVSYTESFTNNYLLTKQDTTDEFYSTLSGNVIYRYKIYQEPIYLGLSLNPAYISYTVAETDLLNLTFTPYATTHWRGLDFSTNVSYIDSRDLDTDAAVSTAFNTYADVSHTFRMPALLRWLAADAEKAAASSTWRFNVATSVYKTAFSTLYDADNYSTGLAFNQDIGNGWRWSTNYMLSKNNNTNILGSDFAYVGNSLSFQLNKTLTQRFSVFGGYTYSHSNYLDPDSFSLFTVRRRNNSQQVTMGVNFFMDQNLRFFGTLGYQVNQSNLPTGFVLLPQDVNFAVGFQSASLGDFTNFTAAMGVAFSF